LFEACVHLAGDGAEVEHGRGRFNYLHSTKFTVRGERVATILHGGSNGHPNIEASGDRAPALADLLRANGDHRVTRCDIANEVYGDGVFDKLEALALRVATDNGLSVRKIGAPLDASAGETVYVGSRSSAVFLRIYEKGKADRAVYSDIASNLLDPWVRCELEIKPQKDMKALAAIMAPEAFWGVSAWTAQFASEALAMAPDPIPFHPRRTASDDRAFAFMCSQYRNLLRRRCQLVHGGDRLALAREITMSVFDQDIEQVA